MADLIARNRDLLAHLISQEVGKPLAQAHGEVAFAEGFLRYNAEWDRRLEGEILPGDSPDETIHLLRVPIGVVGAICPWNFPLAVLCRKLGPALVTGNTIVIKPSEISPLSTIAFVRLVHEHLDLPPGVINLVTGDGRVGQALVDDPLTSLVSFTGHRDTGKSVMARASANLTRVSLELGGKAPAIVWKDADLDLAVPAILAARHTNCGQVCTAAERVLVHRDLLEPFTERYVAAPRRRSRSAIRWRTPTWVRSSARHNSRRPAPPWRSRAARVQLCSLVAAGQLALRSSRATGSNRRCCATCRRP